MLLKTNAPIVIARPSAEYRIVLLALSKCCGLPELVIYLKPPTIKNPVANNPANPAIV